MSEYRFLPLKKVPLPDATTRRYDAWIGELDDRLADPATDRYDLCREVLTDIYFPELSGRGPEELTPTQQLLLDQMDPRKITLEPEYYAETDLERYTPVKPLIWLWEMFDKSPLGENVHLGIKFRRILAKRIFARCGKNFKAFHFVKLSFGYGLEVGDNVVVHRHVLLDDRGGIRIGDGASVSDFVNVYSHSHDISDGRLVRTPRTIIGPRVRIAYHATVLAGVTLAENSMVGAGSMVTRDTVADTIHVGVPAKPAKEKPVIDKRPPTPDPLADG